MGISINHQYRTAFGQQCGQVCGQCSFADATFGAADREYFRHGDNDCVPRAACRFRYSRVAARKSNYSAGHWVVQSCWILVKSDRYSSEFWIGWCFTAYLQVEIDEFLQRRNVKVSTPVLTFTRHIDSKIGFVSRTVISYLLDIWNLRFCL